MTKLNIAIAPNDNYVNQAIVSMMSAVETNKNCEIEFIIPYSTLSQENIDKLNWFNTNTHAKVRLIPVDMNIFDKFSTNSWVTIQAWFRTKLSEFCPDLDRILYVDCDTLITASLEELWNVDLTNHYVACVKDVWDNDKHIKRLKMNSDAYFNSGMLLINCEEWRKNNLFEQIKDFALKNPEKLAMCDQDALNAVIDDNKVLLHQRYNYMETWWRNYYYEYEGAEETAYKEASESHVIIHFTGPKPAYKGCGHSLKGLWWFYAEKTGIIEELKTDFENSKEPVKKEKFINKLFSIKNDYDHKTKIKILTILGIKFKFKKNKNN